MFWLTDRYGPRLTGSPEFEEAGDWAVKQLQSWGVANVRKERFASGRGWSLVNFHATMTRPRVMPIIGVPKSWTPGTNGTFTADVVRPADRERGGLPRSGSGKLRGKIVLTQPAREVRMLERRRHGLRYTDKNRSGWKRRCRCRPARGGAGGAAGAAERPAGARRRRLTVRGDRDGGCGGRRGGDAAIRPRRRRRWRRRAAASTSTQFYKSRRRARAVRSRQRTATWPPAAAT